MICLNDSIEKYENECIWIATLSNGLTVYQDDNSDVKPSSFTRLRKYCYKNNVYVFSLLIRFRSHIENVYSGEGKGFFFRNGILASLANGKNYHSYIIGFVQDNKIYCKTWTTPEIIISDEEVRDYDKEYEDSIIWQTTQTD